MCSDILSIGRVATAILCITLCHEVAEGWSADRKCLLEVHRGSVLKKYYGADGKAVESIMLLRGEEGKYQYYNIEECREDQTIYSLKVEETAGATKVIAYNKGTEREIFGLDGFILSQSVNCKDKRIALLLEEDGLPNALVIITMDGTIQKRLKIEGKPTYILHKQAWLNSEEIVLSMIGGTKKNIVRKSITDGREIFIASGTNPVLCIDASKVIYYIRDQNHIDEYSMESGSVRNVVTSENMKLSVLESDWKHGDLIYQKIWKEDNKYRSKYVWYDQKSKEEVDFGISSTIDFFACGVE